MVSVLVTSSVIPVLTVSALPRAPAVHTVNPPPPVIRSVPAVQLTRSGRLTPAPPLVSRAPTARVPPERFRPGEPRAFCRYSVWVTDIVPPCTLRTPGLEKLLKLSPPTH